jgi:hypothetical protein
VVVVVVVVVVAVAVGGEEGGARERVDRESCDLGMWWGFIGSPHGRRCGWRRGFGEMDLRCSLHTTQEHFRPRRYAAGPLRLCTEALVSHARRVSSGLSRGCRGALPIGKDRIMATHSAFEWAPALGFSYFYTHCKQCRGRISMSTARSVELAFPPLSSPKHPLKCHPSLLRHGTLQLPLLHSHAHILNSPALHLVLRLHPLG